MARGGTRGVLAAALISILAFTAPAASADPGDIGYQDQSWTGFTASVAPSGTKPESKLWFNDGLWWANMYDTASGDFHIFKLDTATQAWVNTGVLTDERPNTMSDVLWDGTKLYIASHVFQDSASTTGFQSRLYRYSYTAATDTYTLDAGFGSSFVSINNVKMETLVIDKDSTGQLWATWTEGNPKQTWVNRTVCNPTPCDDAVWGTPFQLSTSSLDLDDISSVVAFGTAGDGKIGVMWSDQDVAARVNDRMYFAWHSDGDDVDTNWTTEVALSGTNSADDHINLKADSSGRVFAATKTSLGSVGATLNYLLVRTADGAWVTHRFGLYQDHHTRAIVVLDTTNNLIRMFATQSDTGGTIYEKTLAMSSADTVGADFDLTNLGTPRIRDASALKMNNATSTKQSVSSSTGLVVLATNKKTDVTPQIKDYWHAYDPLAGGDVTPPVFQSAQVDGNTLTMTYDEPLDSNSLPATTDFTPKVNTFPRGVTLVSISGSAVTLTLASPVIAGDTVTISYTPGATLLQDVAGNDAAPLADAPVTNVTGSGPPAPVDLLPNGDGTRGATIKTNSGGTTNLFAAIDETIALADDGGTYVKNNPATSGSYFALLTDMPANFGSMATLTIDVRARNVNRVDDNTTLYAQIFQADEATPLSAEVAVAVNPAGWTTFSGISFTGLVPGAKTDWDGARVRLRWEWIQAGAADTSNRLNLTAAELHGTYTTGSDTTPPAFVSGQVNGPTLTMSYNEPLDTGSMPAPSAFTPHGAGGAANGTVTNVAIAGSQVMLTINPAAVFGDTVTLDYVAPLTNPIQDVALNDAPNFAGLGVTNSTPPPPTGSVLTLLPNGDGVIDSVIKDQSGGSTSLFSAIDETIAAADDGATYVRNNNKASGSYSCLLTETPVGFASMLTLTIDVRARTTGLVDDQTTLYARVFAADGTTPLTGEVAVAVNPGPSGFTTISGITFTGLVAGDKATWDGAQLRLRWAYGQVGTADSTQIRVTAVEVDGTFG